MPHSRFMRLALALAKKGKGLTSPNPAVGAVIVRAGRVVGRGYHKKAGEEHAEISALASCGNTKGAALYVTLEPCCHFGKTPPCVDAVIRSGVKTVVVGMLDPNPLVAGGGIRRLEDAGIKVVAGVLEKECRALNEPFIKFITTGTPFFTVKLASSLDGRSAASTGDSKWITGLESRRLVHKIRKASDAVMVGSSTVIKDDPELTVRLVKGRDPLRVIVDSSFRTPLDAKALRVPTSIKTGARPPIVFTTGKADKSKIKAARLSGVDVVVVRRSDEGVDLKAVSAELARRGVLSVLVEGGGTLAASFIREGLADKLMIFYGPLMIGSDGFPSVGFLGVGSVKKAIRLRGMTVKRVSDDILVEGYL
ncbi:MAG: bifunctional diaminohydroxyphosphoribosylaminopyrimidine deaminase/5-amino-6-(5-phosphoribosylamino)uracil reductase RibD [Deltaproteobacteria bacterium]